MSFNFSFHIANGAGTQQTESRKNDYATYPSAEQYAETLGIGKGDAADILDDVKFSEAHKAAKQYAELFDISFDEAANTLGSIYKGIDFNA